MNKNFIGLLAILVLSGCASDKSEQALNNRLNQMDAEIGLLKSEVNAIKGKTIVQLPSGAPTIMEARKQNQTEEDFDYQSAMSFYRGGDLKIGISALEKFNTKYPNSKYQRDAMYYLGQAYYTKRDNNSARQILEQLIYQNPKEIVNPDAFNLLKKVYKEQNEKDKLNALNSYIENN